MRPTTQRRNGQMQGASPASAGVMVPFTAASHEHTELAFDMEVQPGANAQELGPFDIPAYGYYRHFLIQVETVTEGETEAEAAAHEDYPWNVFSKIQVSDVNGADIFGPLPGYSALWASITGGYAGRPDPRVMPYFSSELKKPKYLIRIPQEISHFDGFGSLANQSTAANYKMFLTINSAANMVADPEKGFKDGKAPKLRIRGFVETWSLPNAISLAGMPQAEAPPMLDSSQFYSRFIKDTQNGANTVLLTRVGSLIRTLVVIARDEEGNRSDKAFPNPCTLEWDARRMRTDTQVILQEHLAASVPELKTRDTGVFAYLLDRSTKNTVGDDSPTLWYSTAQSTRLELEGTTEEGGTWEIITNDVAPVSITPRERYTEVGATGSLQNPGFAQAGARG